MRAAYEFARNLGLVPEMTFRISFPDTPENCQELMEPFGDAIYDLSEEYLNNTNYNNWLGNQ